MKKMHVFSKAVFLACLVMLMLFNTSFGQIAQVGSIQTAYAPFSTTITLNKPSGVSPGDIMIVNIVKYTGSNTINPSSGGWTLIDGAVLGGSNYVKGAVLYRIVDGSEGSNFIFSLGGFPTNAYNEGALVAYTGVDLTNPFDVIPGTISTPAIPTGFLSTMVNPSGITTTTSDALIIVLGMNYRPAWAGEPLYSDFSGWSVTSPVLEELYNVHGTEVVSVGAATGTQTTPGATGDGTITVSDGAFLGGIILALRPEPTEPTLTVNPSGLVFGNVYIGSTTIRTFQLSGALLTGFPGNITITAPSADFQVSNDNYTWGTATTVAYNSATLAPTTVYVRFAPQSAGVKSGNLTVDGGGETTPPVVALTGTGIAHATQLAFAGFPGTGTVNSNFTTFNVEARGGDSSIDYLFSGSITLSKASGPGTLTGTLTVDAVNGVAAFSNIQVDQAGTYTLNATSGSLTQATSSPIVVVEGTTNDYRSAASGDWNAAGTWQTYDGSEWLPATSAPTSANANIITIRPGHTITVTSDVSVDQVAIDAGGTVTVSPGIILTIADGSEVVDFNVSGSLNNAGTVTTTGALVVNNGGIYVHNTSDTTLPTATWNTGSTCEITGWTSAETLTDSFDQTFYNFTWNCTGQAVNVLFGGYVNAVNGTFKLESTGSGENYISPAGSPVYANYEQTGGIYHLTNGYDARLLTVPGNFLINDGIFLQNDGGAGILAVGGNYSIESGTHTIGYNTTASAMSVAGNFSMTGGNFNISTLSAASTLTVSGNFSMTSGMFTMSGGTGNTSLFAAGDFSHTGGTITETSDGSGAIVFNGTYNGTTGAQTYTSGGTVTNTIHFTVNSGACLQMAASETAVTGSGTFILSSGATLGITSTDGISSGGSTGNIQTSGRTFNTGATYIYNGTATQSTGDGLPATVDNLVFDNSGGDVTFSSGITITNNFSITSGSRANLGIAIHSAGTLTLGDVLQPGGYYGSTASIATYKIEAYFGATAPGIINVSSGSLPSSWIGNTSTDWNTPSNWFNEAIPTSSTDVGILSSAENQPVISGTTTAVCNSLTINPGASLTINPSGKATVTALINNGTLNLNSDANGIASLLINGSYYGNDANIELFLTGGGGDNAWKWHYISSPVQNTPVTVFNGNIDNLAKYDESEIVASQDDGWVAADGYVFHDGSQGTGFSTLELGKGYAYYFESDQEYTITGPANTGSVDNIALDYNTGGSGNANIVGFNLIGNPFTCTLDWDVVDNNLDPNISTAIYTTKDYYLFPAWNQGVATDNGTNLIPPMQAFFVDVLSAGTGSRSITLPASAKTHSLTARFKGETESIPLVRLLLEAGDNSRDAVIRFDEKAQLSFDGNIDAYCLGKGLGPMSIWTKLNGTDYAINGIPYPEISIDIPVAIHTQTEGTFSIHSNELNGLENYSVTLRDKTTNTIVDLKTGGKLSFSTSAGEFEDRFVLTVSNLSTGTSEITLPENQFNIYAFNGILNINPLSDEWNGKQGSVRITELTGKSILDNRNLEFWKNSIIQLPVPGMKGIFIVEIRSGVMRYVGKVMIR